MGPAPFLIPQGGLPVPQGRILSRVSASSIATEKAYIESGGAWRANVVVFAMVDCGRVLFRNRVRRPDVGARMA